VPVSPKIKAVESVGATIAAWCSASFNPGLLPTMDLPRFNNSEVSSFLQAAFSNSSFALWK
jgi:hypothetical protein